MMKDDYHMDLESFRKNGYKAIDWIVDYLQSVDNYPVLSEVSPGQIRNTLPKKAPLDGETFDAMLKDINELIMPGITHWQSPNFFAYFPANSSPSSILGELISAGLGVQGMSWITSPSCTELETHVMDWLVEMLGLPMKFSSADKGGGVIQHSASDSTLCALLAARERVGDVSINERGSNRQLTAYASTQAHSSIEKSCMISGIGRDQLRLISVDENFSMDACELEAKIVEDKEKGLTPFFICANVGTTSTLAIDPVGTIADIAQRHNLWLHVDAAYAGTAAICEEFRYVNNGAEKADSYTFNPHKWMFTNFDCNAFFVSDRSALLNALSVLPEYLKNKATMEDDVIDYRDWHIPLGRRFRALKLWFVIRHYGTNGLQYHIRKHIEMAQEFKQWVVESENFQLAVDTDLNLICFSHKNGDEITERILELVNSSGKAYLTHTKLNEKFVIRMSIGQTYTEMEHVKKVWLLLNRVAREINFQENNLT